MPARTDKIDAVRLSAALTDMDIEVVPGVDGANIPDKALSSAPDESDPNINGVLGAWRGHLNIARR